MDDLTLIPALANLQASEDFLFLRKLNFEIVK